MGGTASTQKMRAAGMRSIAEESQSNGLVLWWVRVGVWEFERADLSPELLNPELFVFLFKQQLRLA